jgi:hypothetical protein
MLEIVGKTNIDFLGCRRITFTVSALFACLTGGSLQERIPLSLWHLLNFWCCLAQAVACLPDIHANVPSHSASHGGQPSKPLIKKRIARQGGR